MPRRPFRIGRSVHRPRPVRHPAHPEARPHRRIQRPAARPPRRPRSRSRGNRYLYEINSRWTIDGTPRSNIARYVNHSCNPNAEVYDRQAPRLHPRAARHQAGRGNHLRLRHRLSEKRHRALELQMLPLPAPARRARRANGARSPSGGRHGSPPNEAGEEAQAIKRGYPAKPPFVFAPARRAPSYARRIVPPARGLNPSGDVRQPRPAPARRRADRVPLGIFYMLGRHRMFAVLARHCRNGRWPAIPSPRCCSPCGRLARHRRAADPAAPRACRLPHAPPARHIGRSATQAAAQSLIMIALSLMPLAGAMAINFSAPLFATLFAAL